MRRIRWFIIILICFLIIYYVALYLYLHSTEKQEQHNIENILLVSQYEEFHNDGQNDDITYNYEYANKKKNVCSDLSKNVQTLDETDTNIIPEGFDCIVSIPAIQLNKIVYTGSKREDNLNQYELITAAEDMKYINGGNYIICGHSSQIYGHSLNRLKEVNVGDMVYIRVGDIKDTYKVSSIAFEKMNHTRDFCCQTTEQQVTFISCAKYVSDDVYIVIRCLKE